MIGQNETAIVNHNFIEKLEKDIAKYDILYICAPFGWGVDTLLRIVYERLRAKDAYFLEDTRENPLEEQIPKIPKKKKCIYMISGLERIIEHGKQELIWTLLSEKKPGDVFVFASSALLPERLLPYTVLNKYISYGIETIKPGTEDVESYMKNRGISLSKEELLRIENDSKNMPLYIQLLANLLAYSKTGYNRAVREQCFEDLFTYIDVTFFRSFDEEDQNAMLKLSCLDEFDGKLISYMLDISRKEAESFIERLLMKSSVLEKSGSRWKFQPLLQQFLERAIYKYLDYEERLKDYEKAMNYLIGKEQWHSALRFGYILHDNEKMAVCLEHVLAGEIDYSDFVKLETYLSELPLDVLIKYPNLIISCSILKALSGDVKSSRRFEKMYLQLIEQTEDEATRKSMQAKLFYMYLSRPGMMREDMLEISMDLLPELYNDEIIEQNRRIFPNYISILRGEKDYCRYFRKDFDTHGTLEKLHKMADKMNDRTFSIMLQFLEAEVHYERNELDQALDGLVKTTKDAKVAGNQRMQQLCTMAMLDLLASRNQMNSTETFQVERLQAEGKETPLFTSNCQAHVVYYNLLKNNSAVVLDWMKNNSPDENERFYTTQYYQYLIKAKVYIWMGQYVRARMILQMLLDYAEQFKMEYLEAQVRILKSVIYYREGSPVWKEMLIPALQWGKEIGFIRVFADEGAAVFELLNRIAQEEKDWEKDEYLKKVMTAAKAHMLQYPKYLKQEEKGKIGEFSNSEKSVMSLLVLGEKNSEIAERLCVSENTVKYHLKNIYQKLQVTSRSQAIHKIREYNII